MCPIALAFVGNLTVAMIVFGLGGLVWAPFTPVAYSFLQSGLEPDEQQQVVTLWTTGSMVAAPLGLMVGGPLIELAGTTGGLALSGGLTLLLLPIAALAVLRRAPASVTLPRSRFVIGREGRTRQQCDIRREPMKIKLTSVHVDDQEKALRFYTDVLGFVKKADFSQGPYRWLTVASPEDPDGTELQLALNNNPAAKAYQQALFQQSQPAAMFFTDDVQADYERMKARGAEFTMPPTDVTASTIAMLNDTCGNLIQVTQLKRW